MISLSAACRLMILLLAVLGWSGCTPFSSSTEDEEKDPHFLAGKSRVNSMDWPGAIESFEKAVEANPHSGAAHFELGLLYEQHMNDYATAIYHYQKHLKLRPKSRVAETVAQRITACKVELARTVPFALVNQQVHAGLDRLTSENAALRLQLEQLKDQLAQQTSLLSNRAAAPSNLPPRELAAVSPDRTPAKTERPAPAPPAPAAPRPTPTARSYVVKRDETFARIARQQGISLPELEQANPGVNPRKLRVGQAIRIPAPNR